jgi:hypothetical protein
MVISLGLYLYYTFFFKSDTKICDVNFGLVTMIEVLNTDCLGKYKEDVIIYSLNSIYNNISSLSRICIIMAQEMVNNDDDDSGYAAKCLEEIDVNEAIEAAGAKRLTGSPKRKSRPKRKPFPERLCFLRLPSKKTL